MSCSESLNTAKRNKMNRVMSRSTTALNQLAMSSSQPRIIRSRLTLKKYPYNSLIELLLERLKTDPEKGCLVSASLSSIHVLFHTDPPLSQIDCSLDRRWSKKQVLDSSLNFAYYLINDCDVQKGDIVCFVTNNSDIHGIAIIGVLAAGAIYSSMAEHSAEREIREVVENIKPTVLVCFGHNFQTMLDISEDYTFVKVINILLKLSLVDDCLKRVCGERYAMYSMLTLIKHYFSLVFRNVSQAVIY